jgi:hypothetical protein
MTSGTDNVVSHAEPATACIPAAVSSRGNRFYLLIGLAVVVVYTLAYAAYIVRHTALPYWDEWSYVLKTYEIADPGIHFWNVHDVLAAPVNMRGPLFPLIAAEIGGSGSDARVFAFIWLITRTVALITGVALFARVVRSSLVIPTLLLIILGTPTFMTFRSLYMMDQPFCCFAFLMFAAILWDDIRGDAISSWTAGTTIVLLFLVKPAGLVLVFPFLFVRAFRQLLCWKKSPPSWRAVVPWMSGYIGMAVAVWCLLKSPYGQGIRYQYHIAADGAYAFGLGVSGLIKLLSTVVPITVGLGIVLYLIGRWKSANSWALHYAAIGAVFWFAASVCVLYVTDERLIVPVMPIVAAGVVAVLAERPKAMKAVSALAALIFVLNLAIVNGAFAGADFGSYVSIASLQETRETPVTDPGAMELAQLLNAEVQKPFYDAPDRRVCVFFFTHYLDAGTLELAVRELNRSGKGSMQETQVNFWLPAYEAVPFPLDDLLAAHWFMTAATGKMEAGGKIPAAGRAAEELIVDPSSPIRSLVEKIAVRTVHVPVVISSIGRIIQPPLDNQITLWHVGRNLTPGERHSCLAFILPELEGTPLYEPTKREIEIDSPR